MRLLTAFLQRTKEEHITLVPCLTNNEAEMGEQRTPREIVISEASSSTGEKAAADVQSDNEHNGDRSSDPADAPGGHTFTDQTNFVPVRTIITVCHGQEEFRGTVSGSNFHSRYFLLVPRWTFVRQKIFKADRRVRTDHVAVVLMDQTTLAASLTIVSNALDAGDEQAWIAGSYFLCEHPTLNARQNGTDNRTGLRPVFSSSMADFQTSGPGR